MTPKPAVPEDASDGDRLLNAPKFAALEEIVPRHIAPKPNAFSGRIELRPRPVKQS
jgi:hypothetical protein